MWSLVSTAATVVATLRLYESSCGHLSLQPLRSLPHCESTSFRVVTCLYGIYGHTHIASLRVFVWSLVSMAATVVATLRVYKSTCGHLSLQLLWSLPHCKLTSLRVVTCLYGRSGCCYITRLQVFVWSLRNHRTKYPLNKGRAGPDSL